VALLTNPPLRPVFFGYDATTRRVQKNPCAAPAACAYDGSTDRPVTRIPHQFTSKERDAETGLDYFGARHFSAPQGRFTSPDPIIVTPVRMGDPQRFNLYVYGRNNPLRFIDLDGRDVYLANDTEEYRRKTLYALTKNLTTGEQRLQEEQGGQVRDVHQEPLQNRHEQGLLGLQSTRWQNR
jgi:RHS repeat-associated protein